MSKKLKILISALLVATLLTVGTTATVLAEGEEDEDTTAVTEEETKEGFLNRVADILGIEKEDLVNAFEQARQEMCGAAFTDHLNEAVAEGLITQEQADEIIEWWEQRPEGIGEWWGQKPEGIGPGMFRHKFNLRLQNSSGSSSLQIQNRLQSKIKIKNRLSETSCQKLSRQAD